MSAPTVEITVPKTGKTIKVSTGLFINNEFVPSVDSKETIQCVFHASPSPGVPSHPAVAAPCALCAGHRTPWPFYRSSPAIPPAFFPQPRPGVRLNCSA